MARITRTRTVVERTSRPKELTDRQVALRKFTSIIWWFTGLLEAFIGLRVSLRVLGANPGTPFVNFVYGVTAPFLWPFRGLAASPSASGSVLEIYSVIAMIVYLMIAWMIVELLWIVFGREVE